MNRDLQSLLDMNASAETVVSYLQDVSEADFYKNGQLQDAVIRRLLVVGEAANRVSESMRLSLKDVEWNKIRGIRNRLVHEYDEIDLAIVWKTSQEEIPALIDQLKDVLPTDELESEN